MLSTQKLTASRPYQAGEGKGFEHVAGPMAFQPTAQWLDQFLSLDRASVETLSNFETIVRREVNSLGNALDLKGAALLRLKARLARIGYSGVTTRRKVECADLGSKEAKLQQFILGSINLDLRDSVSVGHGVAIGQFGSSDTAASWLERMKEGVLIGAAATESQGGTAKHGFTTRLERNAHGWRLVGRKVSVSRIYEAGGFVVYGQCSNQGLTAMVIDANAPGIRREERKPAGLQGWSWGVLEFLGTPLRSRDILGRPGEGHRVFAAHFAAFRPLVGATALGAAATAWNLARREMRQRLKSGQIARLRDTAIELLAYHKTRIRNALLGVLQAGGGAATPLEEESTLSAKADGVETALEAVRDLRVLVSAERSMIAGEAFDKILRDLEAYRFADGLNGELWRAAGKRLMM